MQYKMKVDLLLTCKSLNQLRYHAVVGFLFENETFSSGYLQQLNDRLENYLTYLRENQLLTGKQQEVFLVAPQEKINTEKILFFGLGPVNAYSQDMIDIAIKKALLTLEKLYVYDLLILISSENIMKAVYIDLIKSLMAGLINYCNEKKKGEFNVVFLIEEHYKNDLKNLEKELRPYFNPTFDYSILIEVD